MGLRVGNQGDCSLQIRWILAALAGILSATAFTLAFAASASAYRGNVFSASITGSGSDSLSEPSSVAVDNSTGASAHDLYVADPPNHRVEKFSATGEFLLMFGREVNATTHGNVCTAAETCQDGVSSVEPGGFQSPTFVAVDGSTGPSAGDVYVGDTSDGVVSKFNESGALIKAWGSNGQLSGFEPLRGIAVDQAGRVFILAGTQDQISWIEESGALHSVLVIPVGEPSSAGLGVDNEDNLYYIDGPAEEVRECGDLCGNGLQAVEGPSDPIGLSIDPHTNELYVVQGREGGFVNRFALNCGIGCTPLESFGSADLTDPTGIGIDGSTGTIYVADTGAGSVAVAHFVTVPNVTTGPVEDATQKSVKLTGHVDPDAAHGGGQITECFFEYGETTAYGHKASCEPSTPYTGAEDVTAQVTGLTSETTHHYRLVAGNSNGTHAGEDLTFSLRAVADLSTEAVTNPESSAAKLNGSFAGNGEDTHFYFQWGETTEYGNETSHQDAGSEAKIQNVSETISGLESVMTYHFRFVAENSTGTTYGADQSFTTPPNAPVISAESAIEIHSDSALVHFQVNPGGGKTAYHVEYVEDKKFKESGFAEATQSPSAETKASKESEEFNAHLSALSQATTYHYRVVATNADDPSSPVQGAIRTFTTLPFIPSVNDQCPNAHVRQQTGAEQLLDCRAYELVSAANTGGYDVESNVVPGQTPFAGYPEAQGKVLYGVHNGGIPGTNDPTNKGLDPYVATRGENGWSTEYVGIPANDPEAASSDPYSSTPTGADASLETFAFGAPGGCSPCFSDGSTGIPVRKPNGELIQGMAGPENPGPSATADGHIAAPLSANGEHFIFGSASRFARGGNDQNGNVSIYERNLKTGETHVVSNTPNEGEDGPEPLPCVQGEGKCNSAEHDENGISELAISSDGSHVLLGQKVSEDSEGHPYYHLYMDVNDAISSIDLTPEVIAKQGGEGFKEGVLFAGMTSDGSKVFFTTKDALHTATNQDTDESADLYLAEVSGQSSTLTRISTGSEGTGNTDTCDPVANSAHEHWNVLGSEKNCGVVAIGGGGGVATGDGTVYFLSPEKLDGSANGVQNAPNLYVAHPSDGYAPRFVATLESVLTGPQPPVKAHTLLRKFGSLSTPSFVAVDESPGGGGDVYVADTATSTVFKFGPTGNPITNWGEGGHLKGDSTERFGAYIVGIAVDSAGTLYVMSGPGEEEDNHLFKFEQDGNFIEEFPTQFLNLPASIAVDNEGNIYKIRGNGDAAKLNPSGEAINEEFDGCECGTGIAIDPTSHDVYVDHGAEIAQREPLGAIVGSFGSGLLGKATGLAVSPVSHDVLADEGNQVIEFEPSSGNQVGASIGSGLLSGSRGLAADSAGDLYVTNGGGGNVAEFGPPRLPPSPSIDNPLVVDSVSAPETHHSQDFQVSPNGAYAAFPSTLALGGGEEETAGHTVLYRYDASSAGLNCVSCTSTGAPSEGDSSMAEGGLSLLNDGRVFFNSTDQLVAADTDAKQDIYEFAAPGAGNCSSESTAYDRTTGDCLALISAGTSAFDSGLLTASSNGKDAFFFTRDSLAPQDKNGDTMKIYDAREGGGFPYIEPEQQCQASDECHGAASPAPGPANVGSTTLSPGNVAPVCGKGSASKNGICAPKHKHNHKKRHHRRTNNSRGGAK